MKIGGVSFHMTFNMHHPFPLRNKLKFLTPHCLINYHAKKGNVYNLLTKQAKKELPISFKKCGNIICSTFNISPIFLKILSSEFFMVKFSDAISHCYLSLI